MSMVRADMVTVFIFRRRGAGIEFLQLLRAKEPFHGTWHPVAGGIEAGETAGAAARREAREEAGLEAGAIAGFWQLDGVYPFFMARHDAVMLAPALAIEVEASWEPVLNHENSAWRWIGENGIATAFMWAGQRESCREVAELLRPGSATERVMRVDPSAGGGPAPR